jgi:RNA polymerase primary sigma factor
VNIDYILSYVKPYLNDNNELSEDKFEDLFGFMKAEEKDAIYDVLVDNDIEIIEDLDDYDETKHKDRRSTQKTSPKIYIDPKKINLSNEELCVMYQRGEEIALDMLVIKNDGLLNQRAGKYTKLYNHKLDFEDLKHYGFIGMKKAAERFDLNKEAKFTTYAVWWIDQCIKRNICDYGFTIRVPVHVFDKIGTVINIQRQTGVESINELIDILCDEKGYTRENASYVIFLYNYIVKPTSLDLPVGESEDITILEMIHDPIDHSVEKAVEDVALRAVILKVLDTLTPREEKVMRLRFGIDDGEAKTLEEVGHHFNVTRERIRQIQAKALRKLRHPSRSKLLKDFLD